MRFVLGKPHKNAPSDWYILINKDSAELVANLVQRVNESKIRQIADHARGKQTKAPWTVMEVYTKTTFMSPFTIAKRFGWYANRHGGMCPSLYDIEEETETKRWPNKMTPQDLLKTVKITKWQNGKHWHAKLADGREVEYDERDKWPTRERAIQATKKFLGIK